MVSTIVCILLSDVLFFLFLYSFVTVYVVMDKFVKKKKKKKKKEEEERKKEKKKEI